MSRTSRTNARTLTKESPPAPANKAARLRITIGLDILERLIAAAAPGTLTPKERYVLLRSIATARARAAFAAEHRNV